MPFLTRLAKLDERPTEFASCIYLLYPRDCKSISSAISEIWFLRALFLVPQVLYTLLALRSKESIARSILSMAISIQSIVSSVSSASSLALDVELYFFELPDDFFLPELDDPVL